MLTAHKFVVFLVPKYNERGKIKVHVGMTEIKVTITLFPFALNKI